MTPQSLPTEKDSPIFQRQSNIGCVSIIGMAGCGKSTIGRECAKILGWACVDTDYVLESYYGTRLQNIANSLDKEAFLDLESSMVCQLRLQRTIISTGGSVVYREQAMQHLASLGVIVRINTPLDVVLERIARKPDRGLAIAPGQTLEDLFKEREVLYCKYSNFTLETGTLPATEYAQRLAIMLQEKLHLA